jgi:hypothetical protein
MNENDVVTIDVPGSKRPGVLAIGEAAAESVDSMVPGEIRVWTHQSAMLQIMPGGDVLVNSHVVGRDPRVGPALRRLVVASPDSSGVRSLFFEDGAPARPEWARTVSGVVAIGSLARPTEDGEIAICNLRGQVFRLSRSGRCYSEHGQLWPGREVPHLRSVLAVRWTGRLRSVLWPLVGVLTALAFAGVVAALLVGAGGGVASERLEAWIRRGR